MNWPVEVTAPAICWCVPAGCGQEQANCSKPEKVDANIHVFDQSRPKQHAAIAIHVHDSRMMYCWTTGSSQLMAELGFFCVQRLLASARSFNTLYYMLHSD
jgi:hypothetical protein